MSKKFLTLPLAAYSDYFDRESDAFDKAKQNAASFESDFVVVEVRFLGVYQRVTPIFSGDDPTEQRPAKPARATLDGSAGDLDDIPF